MRGRDAVAGKHATLFGAALTTWIESYLVLAVVGALGYLVGSLIGWSIGVRGGRPLIERYGRWLHVGPQAFARAETWFDRFGPGAVFFGRLTPVVRSFISIPVGVLGSPLPVCTEHRHRRCTARARFGEAGAACHGGERQSSDAASFRLISSGRAIFDPMKQAYARLEPPQPKTVQLPHRHASEERPLTVVDVALHFGAGHEGLGTYLRAKQRYAERSGGLIHHAVVPAAHEHHFGRWHELPGSRRSEHDQRFSARPTGLIRLLSRMTADVVVLHGPFHNAERVIDAARWTGAIIVAVPHRVALGSGEGALWAPGRWWLNRAELRAVSRVDAVFAPAAAGTPGAGAVRLGVDPEFRPRPGLRRGDTVVFAGELSWSAGVFELLWATSCASTPWQVLLVGRGQQAHFIQRRAADFGLSHRVRIEPFVTDRLALASTFATAGCVVSPGPPHRGQLVTLEAAATGVPVVAPEGSLIATLAPALTRTFPSGNVEELAKAIQAGLAGRSDPQQAAQVREEHTWERAFECELSDLRARLDRS